MADIQIHRDHQLGLAKARKVALQWAEQVETEFDMACTILEGETSDTVEFSRSGVKGELIVAANHFTLDAKLGFLLGAFSKRIEHSMSNSDSTCSAHCKATLRAFARPSWWSRWMWMSAMDRVLGISVSVHRSAARRSFSGSAARRLTSA